MSTIQRTHRPIATLKLPKGVPALIGLTKTVLQAMTGNATFPTPEPPLATVAAALADLETAEIAAQARTRGAATVRNDKRAILVQALQELRAYVQRIANATPETAAAIIQSAGVSLKKPTVPTPRVFGARAGTVSGSVKLVASSAARRASYEWEYSADGGKTWVVTPVTLQAKTSIAGLTPGASVTFRYRGVTKTGEGDWSQPISFIVR